MGRASIVGAAETSVGKVREHNEDSHFIDPEAGIFIVCDGMGGHAAGEVASNLAVKTIRAQWSADATQTVTDQWLSKGTPDARKQLLTTVTQGVLAAHDAIVAEAAADISKKGMGTTVVAAIIIGGDVVFAHCGDSRAYLVRDGITVQLTEDHTLLARLLAAGVDVDVDGDGARFKSMLTNALGIGHECKVSTFVVPVADGDRFLLCSDGITEYLAENEIGEVLTTMPSPARSAQRLVEIALQRGGGDNATALVVRVLEAGETARPSEQLRREELAINSCPLWAKLSPQQRLRALRIALPRDYATGEKIPAQTLSDRVSWILVEGECEQDGHLRGPGALLYPEAMLDERPLPDKNGLAVAQSDVRALALRMDDFKELCEDDPELGAHLLEAIGLEITRRRPQRRTGKINVQFDEESRGKTDPADPGNIDTQPINALQAVEPVVAPVTEPIAEPVVDVGRADTLQRPAVAPDDRPAQPRASTVPPAGVRKRATTDHGTPSPRISRGSTPPTESSRSSLIVQPADTSADVDKALTGMTDEADGWELPAEPATEPASPMAKAPSAPLPSLRPPAPQALRPPAPRAPTPPVKVEPKGTHLSEPEIHIEELVEMVADSEHDEPEAPAVALSLDDEDDDSSGTITVTVDDPPEAISVEPLVAADSKPNRRPPTDSPEK